MQGNILKNLIQGEGEGWNGNYIDNPGNLQSATLNEVSKLCTQSFQKTRDALLHFNEELRNELKLLRESKGHLRFISNSASLF